MKAYELMIIYDGDLTEIAVDDAFEKSMNTLTANGGRIATVNKWGRRKFAYEINHKSEGYYVVVEFLADDADLAAFERTMRLDDPVVRHKLIRLPDREARRRDLFSRITLTEAEKQSTKETN